MEEVEDIFDELEDPRTGNAKRHPLHEIALIALCTVLCGGETCADMAPFGRLFDRASAASPLHLVSAWAGGRPAFGSGPDRIR